MKQDRNGFSLIELSILLLVLGLAVSGFLYAYNTVQERDRQEEIQFTFRTVADSLERYKTRNGHYPCPAPLTAPPGTADYGLAQDCTLASPPSGIFVSAADTSSFDHDNNSATSNISRSGNVWIGALPFKELGIGEEDSLDPYKNRLTYAVSRFQAIEQPNPPPGFSTEAYLPNGGHIEVYEVLYNTSGATRAPKKFGASSTPDVPDAPDRDYVVLSHGKNGNGAYTRSGRLYGSTACNNGSFDQTNCNHTGADGHTFYHGAKSTVDGSDYFDDDLIYDPWSWVYLWDETSTDTQSIYNRNSGTIGIGTELPDQTAALHVSDAGTPGQGNLRIENGSLNNRGLCDSSGLTCFEAEILGGNRETLQTEDKIFADTDEDDTNNAETTPQGGIYCSNDKYMVRIANNDADCRSILGDGSCGDRSFATGLAFTGGTVRMTCTNAISGSTSNVTLN